jgi:hypothetical protein
MRRSVDETTQKTKSHSRLRLEKYEAQRRKNLRMQGMQARSLLFAVPSGMGHGKTQAEKPAEKSGQSIISSTLHL